MARQVILEPERTFSEFNILPNYTPEGCSIQHVSLDTNLGKLHLRLPLMSAAMQSVTGYDMAIALGKEGGIGILPARLRIDHQASLVERVKAYEPGFVENPLTLRPEQHVEEALATVMKHGHSKIPIVDRNNTLLGLFTYDHYLNSDAGPGDSIRAAMFPLNEGIPTIVNPDISLHDAARIMDARGEKYLVVLDDQGRVEKLAFKKDIERVPIGVAISTYPGWKERVDATVAAGADLIVIDTSDAFSFYAGNVIDEYKGLGLDVPICAGNVVTYEGAKFLMERGADAVKVGMSSGSICTTRREKGTGRAPLTALIEVDRARQDYFKETGRYVHVVIDGGVPDPASMSIALTLADSIMMGNYFNKFYEAAGKKFDELGKETAIESNIAFVETFGEGSSRAQNYDRYGHKDHKTFFAEGEAGKVPYIGRLKPQVKQDMLRVRAAMVNVGAMTLDSYRRNAVIALASPAAQGIVATTHSMAR